MIWQLWLYRLKLFFKKHLGVIVSSVIAILLAALIERYIGFDWIKACLYAIGSFSFKKTSISYWSLSLIFIGGFILCLAILYLPKIIRQNLNDYRNDEVKGLIWEWDRSGRRDIVDLKSLCPNCQGELKFHDEYKKYYACSCCNFEKEIKSRQYEFEHGVYIEIKRRIRTGEWRLAKRRIKAIAYATTNHIQT